MDFQYPTKDQFKKAAMDFGHAVLTRDFSDKPALLLDAYVIQGYAFSHYKNGGPPLVSSGGDDGDLSDDDLLDALEASIEEPVDGEPGVVGSLQIPWKLIVKAVVKIVLKNLL